MPKLIDQPTLAPTRKVAATGIAGLVTTIAIAVVEHFVPGAGEMIGPQIAALIVTGVAALAGYFTRDYE